MERLTWSFAVAIGSKHYEKALRRQVGVRELPVDTFVRILRQPPILQIHRARTVVVDFNPILILTKIVTQGLRVTRHEFGDLHLREQLGRRTGKQHGYGKETKNVSHRKAHQQKVQRLDANVV